MSFPDPKIPLSGEETIVGVHHSGISLQEGLNTSISRYYCSSCKKKIHCYVKVDKDTKEAVVHNTCKSVDCECKCKTHYACKQCGSLHPYGEECNRPESQMTPYDPKSDKLIEEINKIYNESRKETKVESKT
jgi:hypothetical protein